MPIPVTCTGCGRHAGMRRLFALVVDLIGTTGVTVLAVLAVLACVGWIVLRVQKRPMKEVIRSRSGPRDSDRAARR